MIVLGLLAVGALTLGTAVAVATEFSVTALERSRLDAHVAAVGDRRARAVARAHRTLSFQLSGCQLVITLTTLVTGYVAEPAIAALLRPALPAVGATTLALVLATALSMVFGELVPKNVAIAEPLRTARLVVPVQAAFTRVLRPLIGALNRSANAVVRRVGVQPAEELRSARSPGELGSLVRASGRRGTLDVVTARLMDRSLRFHGRVAEDLMTPRTRVVTLAGDDTLADLVARARGTGLSRFPVRGDDPDTLLGVVHVKQAFAVAAGVRAATPLHAQVRAVPVVPQSLDGETLMTTLRGSGLQLAVVVDEYGGVAGIVTLEDVLEEIVGEARDEHDHGDEPPGVRPDGPGCWLVSGRLRGDEVGDALGLLVPPGAYETLAGFVLARLGRIPDVDDEVVVDGWRLVVARREGLRVAELRLHRPTEPRLP